MTIKGSGAKSLHQKLVLLLKKGEGTKHCWRLSRDSAVARIPMEEWEKVAHPQLSKLGMKE